MSHNTTHSPAVKPGTRKRKPFVSRERYHHGDLRRDLLRVAREEIARNGAGAVSLASLASLAGVSQPAPYRHFADRDALLESVAAAGFEEFAAILSRTDAAGSADDRLKTIAHAYVAFGEANTELYRLMFASRLTPDATAGSGLDTAAAGAFATLRAAVAIGEPTQAEEFTFLIWSQLHGLVMLKADSFIVRPLAGYVDAIFSARRGG